MITHSLCTVKGMWLQRLVVQALYDPMDELEKLEAVSGTKGCVYCGGLGHRIANCPKLAQNTREVTRQNKDYFGKGGFGGEV